MAAPLKLKSERVGKITLADHLPYLSVLVDTGVFHLSEPFDYSLPAKFDVQPGQWVSVPFHGRNLQGLVIERKLTPATAKVLPINRVVKGPFISQEHLRLYVEVANRWAVPIFDVLRFVTKERSLKASNIEIGDGKRSYLQLKPVEDEISQILAIAAKLKGRTLVIVPEARTATALEGNGFEVGMRGSVLTSRSFKNIVVVREDSENHYELKSPGFNTRDVALLRNELLHENLLFIGFSPSLEMTRLLEGKFVTLKSASGKITVTAKPSLQGELIPSALLSKFKDYLNKGPVLVVAPSKGYGLAISCAACRNIATCDCGGKLTKSSKSAPAHCVICAKEYLEWRCTFCHKDRMYLLGRGIERIAEDFGRTFPNTQIHIATADKQIEGDIPRRSIVLSTVGAAPTLKYSATFFLDGLNLGSDMRNEERFLSILFRYGALSNGNVLMVERSESPIVNSLIKWNPFSLLRRLVSDLSEAGLPPSSRHILIKIDESERIFTGLQSALRESRIPANTRIHNLGSGIISIFFSLKDAKQVIAFIYELQRRRSMAGKELLKVRIDPYLLG